MFPNYGNSLNRSSDLAAPQPAPQGEARRFPAVHCFSVVAAAEPGAMPRILEFFAKRGLVPSRWVSHLGGSPLEGELSIDVQIEGLDEQTARLIACSIGQLQDVRLVLTSEKAAA